MGTPAIPLARIYNTATTRATPTEQSIAEVENQNALLDWHTQLQAAIGYRESLPIARDAELALPARTPEEFRARWGLTMQEAADALVSVFGHHQPSPAPIGDSNDGIAPCGYEEL